MRVDRITGGAAQPAKPAADGSNAAAFASLLAQETEAGAEVAPLEAACATARRMEVTSDRTARRHGRAMLHALGALQLALLAPPFPGPGSDRGEPTAEREDNARAHLADLARRMPSAEDAVLSLILREIGVRAAIELARSNS